MESYSDIRDYVFNKLRSTVTFPVTVHYMHKDVRQELESFGFHVSLPYTLIVNNQPIDCYNITLKLIKKKKSFWDKLFRR
tara:strand:+ start:954 stop:1193 length:240 start_codon:yes stop_codon:yes gene_type:complete